MEVNTTELANNSEHWASIDGYLNYQVSWWRRVRNTNTGRILKNGMTTHGYLKVNLFIDGRAKIHYIHQLVARGWVPNPIGKRCVDHIDGCKTNNHYNNLRWATHTENMRNRCKFPNASSIYKGVSLNKARGKWQASVKINGEQTHLGLYTNEREAAEAYNKAALEHYKEFARLNEFED